MIYWFMFSRKTLARPSLLIINLITELFWSMICSRILVPPSEKQLVLSTRLRSCAFFSTSVMKPFPRSTDISSSLFLYSSAWILLWNTDFSYKAAITPSCSSSFPSYLRFFETSVSSPSLSLTAKSISLLPQPSNCRTRRPVHGVFRFCSAIFESTFWSIKLVPYLIWRKTSNLKDWAHMTQSSPVTLQLIKL